jgi:hypothetical protein
MATVGRAFGTTFGGLSQALGTLFKRMLPADLNLPAPVMALTALIVPLVVVGVAMVIYFQRGVAGQYESLYSQAQQAAGAAQAQSDPVAQEQAWLTVLQKLDEANRYQNTTSDPLRMQAQQAIDALNLTHRLDFQPAIIEVLPSQTQVSALWQPDTDLYMLDARHGSVSRHFCRRGHDIDTTFQCGPGFRAARILNAGGHPLVPQLDGWQCVWAWTACNLLSARLDRRYSLAAGAVTGWGRGRASPSTPATPVLDSADQAGMGLLMAVSPLPQTCSSTRISRPWKCDRPGGWTEDLFLLHQDGHITLCNITGFGVTHAMHRSFALPGCPAWEGGATDGDAFSLHPDIRHAAAGSIALPVRANCASRTALQPAPGLPAPDPAAEEPVNQRRAGVRACHGLRSQPGRAGDVYGVWE